MQLANLRTRVMAAGVLAAALCLYPQSTPSKDAHGGEPQGIPPRATPADYQAHAQAGAVTIAADFAGHFVPTAQGTLTTEDWVAVEAGLFGEPGTRIKLSPDDFSLRINGKKAALPSQPYGMVTGSLKDPEWELAQSSPSEPKQTTVLNTGGDDQKDPKATPTPVHIPIGVQRAMAQRVQKASLAEGDRTLPQAGLLFFPYRRKTKDIRSIELIYNGPAGQATLALQP